MKTEKEVKKILAGLKKDLIDAQKRFDEYDDHDDLTIMDRLDAQVKILQLILK